MNALSTFAIALGLLAGVALAAAAKPLVSNTDLSWARVANATRTSYSFSGEIAQVGENSFTMTLSDVNGTAKKVEVRYDKDTALVARARGSDASGATVATKILTAPIKDALTIGTRVRATLWITEQTASPYAIAVFTNI